jgi:hypothetical protein
MARHLIQNTLSHFNNFIAETSISSPSLHSKISPFNKVTMMESYVASGEINGYHLYKTTPADLGRIPMYAMINGIHNSKWINHIYGLKNNLNVGDSLFDMLDVSGIGTKADDLYSILNAARYNEDIHKSMLTLPFIHNPAALNLNEEDTRAFMEESLDSIGQLPDNMYTVQVMYKEKGTYNQLHRTIGNSHLSSFCNFYFKKATISANYGALVDFERGKVLAMLTLNTDYVEYFLLHKYSKSRAKLYGEIFNLVVDKEFAANSGEHYAKELWRMVRMGMSEALPSEVTTEVIDGTEFFNELYSNKLTTNEPTLGPLEQIEQNAEAQEEYILDMLTEKMLSERNIVLHE